MSAKTNVLSSTYASYLYVPLNEQLKSELLAVSSVCGLLSHPPYYIVWAITIGTWSPG